MATLQIITETVKANYTMGRIVDTVQEQRHFVIIGGSKQEISQLFSALWNSGNIDKGEIMKIQRSKSINNKAKFINKYATELENIYKN